MFGFLVSDFAFVLVEYCPTCISQTMLVADLLLSISGHASPDLENAVLGSGCPHC